MNSYKIKPKFPEDDGVRFPEELAEESAEQLKKAGYDASVVDKYYVQVNGDIDESELSRWGTIMNSRIIKSDATDDIIRAAHSDYFDALEDLFDRFNVQYRDSHVINGGRIFYIEPGQVEFKHPNSGEYVPLLMAQLYADGNVYLSDKKYGGGWNAINVPLDEVFVRVNDTYINCLGMDKSINSSRQIKSARYIATDPESGEVLGSADTYEEAVNEWGEDVTITDSEAAEGQEESGLFSSNKTIKSSFYDDDDDTIDVEVLAEELVNEGYEPDIVEQIKDQWLEEGISELTDDEDRDFRRDVERLALNSSNKLNGDKAFLSNIVSSVLSQSMTQEQAVKRIALRNNCNQAFAKNILSNALEDTSIIQSGIMAIADDINKDFNIDGDIESWFTDYVPREGAANTVGGEILRAFTQIRGRYYNDGDKIGVGMGKDTVNPAARYLVDKCVGWTEVSNIEEMLSGDSDINKDNDNYSEWLEDCEYSLEDYLRNNKDYFHTVNKDDIWDYKTEYDNYESIDEVFIIDDNNNEYWFQGNGDGWHCYTINYSTQPKYHVDEWVDDLDDIPDTSGDFCDFELDGFEYSAEKSRNGQDWMITDVRLPNGIVQVDEEWETSDFEPYTIYDSQGREISINELY